MNQEEPLHQPVRSKAPASALARLSDPALAGPQSGEASNLDEFGPSMTPSGDAARLRWVRTAELLTQAASAVGAGVRAAATSADRTPGSVEADSPKGNVLAPEQVPVARSVVSRATAPTLPSPTEFGQVNWHAGPLASRAPSLL